MSVTNPYKPEIKSSMAACIKSSKWSATLAAIGLLVVIFTWNFLHKLELNLYNLPRSDLLFVQGSRSMLELWGWMLSPLIHPESAAELYDRVFSGNWGGHRSNVEWYDPKKHNNEYRHVELNVVSEDECALLRSMILKNAGDVSEASKKNWDDGLILEFHESPIMDLLRKPSESTTEEEKRVLPQVLTRTQRHVENAFHNKNIFMEFGGGVVRTSPVSTRGSWFKKWWFKTSGGHATHSDLCQLQARGSYSIPVDDGIIGRLLTWLLPRRYSWWNHPWECPVTFDIYEHCCFFRTTSALLYINNATEEYNGGALFLVDRKDLGDPAKPSFSGGPLAKLAENVLHVKPSCGTLAMFASDTRNIHGVLPLAEGQQRFALPMWFTAHKDLPKDNSGATALGKEQLETVEKLSRTVCERYDTSRSDNFPPPSGLSQGNCEAWLNELRDPKTLVPRG